MDITLNIISSFETVFLINGKLFEGGEIIYGESEVIYITALPLSALMLPYTVKMVGGCAKSNPELIKCYALEPHKYLIKFSPRYSYVYSVPFTEKAEPQDLPEKLFRCVLEKRTEEARKCLSRELSDSIDDKSLLGFFDGFKDIIAAERSGLYYLISVENRGILYNFVTKNGAIDNIVEL